MKIERINTFVLIGIWTLFGISIISPALTTARGDVFVGLNLVMIGWLGIFTGKMFAVSWYANLLFIYIAVQTGRGKKTKISHVLMWLLAITAFMPMEIMLNENGDTSVVTEYNLGFYLWISAMGLLSALVFSNRYFYEKQGSFVSKGQEK